MGLDELQVRLLNLRGNSRVNLGDEGGLDDLTQSIARANETQSFDQLQSSLNNLMTRRVALGQLEEARETFRLVQANFERCPTHHRRGWVRHVQAELSYAEGNWQRARSLVEEFITELDAGSPHYLESPAHELRCSLRIAFGDREGAAADSKQALEAGRRTGDGQLICAMLLGRARTELDEGRAAEAKVLALEGLGYGDRVVHILNDVWIVDAAWVMLDLGLADDYRRLTAEHSEIPWARAATAICSGDLPEAVDVLEEIGYRPGAAYARLRYAKQLVDEGRRAEADAELERSLAFWREVGATRYVREGEALLAASA
jgi:hypothetical protein